MRIEDMLLPDIAVIRIYTQKRYDGLFFMGKCVNQEKADKYIDIMKRCDVAFDNTILELISDKTKEPPLPRDTSESSYPR